MDFTGSIDCKLDLLGKEPEDPPGGGGVVLEPSLALVFLVPSTEVEVQPISVRLFEILVLCVALFPLAGNWVLLALLPLAGNFEFFSDNAGKRCMKEA